MLASLTQDYPKRDWAHQESRNFYIWGKLFPFSFLKPGGILVGGVTGLMPNDLPSHFRRHTHPSGCPAASRLWARPASCFMFLPYSSTVRCCLKCLLSITMAPSSSYEAAEVSATEFQPSFLEVLGEESPSPPNPWTPSNTHTLPFSIICSLSFCPLPTCCPMKTF